MPKIVKRVVAVVAGLVVIGLALRLVGAMLSPVMPQWFMRLMAAGGDLLYLMLMPALPAAAALGLLWLGWWLVSGHR